MNDLEARCKCGKYKGNRYIDIICDHCYHIVAHELTTTTCDWCGKLARETKVCGCGRYMCSSCYYKHDQICKHCNQKVEEYMLAHPLSPRSGDTREYIMHVTEDGRLFMEDVTPVISAERWLMENKDNETR